jgi:hypothetical protein
MNALLQPVFDRVRNNSPEKVNREIDDQTKANISYYMQQGEVAVRERIKQLDKEWDVDRMIILWASTVMFSGLLLTVRNSPKWILLPAIASGFLAYHALKGWCPPVSLFRRLKVRTRKEIDREKYALIQKLRDRSE